MACAEKHQFHNNNRSCSANINGCIDYNTNEGILKCLECEIGSYLGLE